MLCGSIVFLTASNAESAVDNKYQEGITLTITNKPFDPKAHKIELCSDDGKPCIIDGKIFYGGNGEIPKMEVTSLVFSQHGKEIHLDVSSMYDGGITNSNIKKFISVQPYLVKNSYMIVGYFGDDKKKRISPYIAHWLVLSPKGSVRNHLGDYESLTGLVYKVNEDYNIPQ